MMWSQCTCDMKMLKVFARPGPCLASTRLPNSRAPLPRSHKRYSSRPVSISTQLVLPPKVPLTENGSSLSRNASIASGLARSRSRTASSAARILARTPLWLRATGKEPRVPQKRTPILGVFEATASALTLGSAAGVQAAIAASTESNAGITC